jgi:hypothetical protein
MRQTEVGRAQGLPTSQSKHSKTTSTFSASFRYFSKQTARAPKPPVPPFPSQSPPPEPPKPGNLPQIADPKLLKAASDSFHSGAGPRPGHGLPSRATRTFQTYFQILGFVPPNSQSPPIIAPPPAKFLPPANNLPPIPFSHADNKPLPHGSRNAST